MSVNIMSRVLFLFHCHEFPNLSIYLIKFGFCPCHNTCTMSMSQYLLTNSPCFHVHDLVSTNESNFHDKFRSPQISPRKFSFILLSQILLYSEIPRYLYPFSSTSLILSTSDISTPSDHTTFPLFNTSTTRFFIPNFIPIYVQLNSIHLLHVHTLQRSLIHP